MQITNDNIIFNGAFRLKPNAKQVQKDVPELFTQGKQVFSDILEKGDKVIVLRDQYDKRVGKYIKDNNITDIEYYPQINTKCGLDTEEPEKLINLIQMKTTKVITDLQEMFETIAKQKRPKKPARSKNMLENISTALRLNIEHPLIVSTKNSTVIRDNTKKRTIEIISKVPETLYVYVKPDSIGEASTRCIINSKGQVVKTFETPEEIHKFFKNFNKAKKEGVNIPIKF